MKFDRIVFLIIIVLLSLTLSCGKADKSSTPVKAANFSLASLSGKLVQLTDYEGRVVLLNFWATWCPPCRDEIPDFIKLEKKYKEKGLSIIGISLDTGNPEEVLKFTKSFGVNYEILMAGDKRQELFQAYGNFRGIPTTFLIDREGYIIKQSTGYTKINIWEKALNKLF